MLPTDYKEVDLEEAEVLFQLGLGDDLWYHYAHWMSYEYMEDKVHQWGADGIHPTTQYAVAPEGLRFFVKKGTDDV